MERSRGLDFPRASVRFDAAESGRAKESKGILMPSLVPRGREGRVGAASGKNPREHQDSEERRRHGRW